MTTELQNVLDQLPRQIERVHVKPIQLNLPFIDVARKFSHLPGTTALVSGGSLDCARYNLLAINPWLLVRALGDSLTVECGTKSYSVKCDPFEVIRALLNRYELPAPSPGAPVIAGLFGYFSYDLKDELEVLPRTSIDDLNLPQVFLAAPSVLLVHDRVQGTAAVYLPEYQGDDVEQRFAEFERLLAAPAQTGAGNYSSTSGLFAGVTRDEYKANVAAIKDYIVRGHVYQVNLSQRYEVGFKGDAFELFAAFFAKNPAPFFAYINAADHQILSTSPERFLKREGSLVETRPIKGTRPRGTTPEQDERNRVELLESRKDDAELSMIVDLLRNDIGKVCQAGSVKVVEHKRLEAYDNVYHLVSLVTGQIDEDKDSIDLICATFPGGSITGCPKIRSMEVIDELEPVRRHIYTGSIGYLSFHDTLDLSIAIRTATVVGDRLLFSVGGGVVFDSDPDAEFEETLHKGRTLMDGLKLERRTANNPGPFVWHNGLLREAAALGVPIESEGFLYGYGFFETLRAEAGYVLGVSEHIDRFNRAWRTFFHSEPPDVTWSDVFAQVLERNGLTSGLAAVRLHASRGMDRPGSSRHHLLVSARPYVHRLSGTNRRGIRLAVYPSPRETPLADHKTTNYMYCKIAANWAKASGADEAIILNADGTVSETNSASLLCVSNGTLVQPMSDHALPGTMASAVGQLVESWGMKRVTKRLTLDELIESEQVFITNSLIGAIAATHIDERTLGDASAFCERLNSALLNVVRVRPDSAKSAAD